MKHLITETLSLCLSSSSQTGGSRPQGLFTEGGKELVDRLAQIFFNLGIDGLDIHRRHFGTEFCQGLTVFGRHILRLLGCNLAQFHVGGP